MTSLTQKFSILALFFVVFGTSTALAQSNDDQVSFTATGSGVVTSVTHLPGGLTEINFNASGQATHLGDYTGAVTRIQDNHGNFNSTFVLIGANEKDTIFLTTSGTFETSKDKCLITSTGTYTVTGGTGAFANATGSGTIATETDLCAGTALGTFTGTISRPNSN